MSEIFYRVNNGPIKRVSVDGQPYITSEGANNTLEYWSVDEAGNEEIPHQLLDEIKLDKTSPIINFNLPGRIEVETNMTFDASKSGDALSGIGNYLWDFGDGTIEYGPSVTHVYNKTGTYNLTLIITDNAGNLARYVKTISVSPKFFPYLWQILGISGFFLFTAILIFSVRNKRKKHVKEDSQEGMPEPFVPPAPTPLEPAVKKIGPVKPVKSREEEIDDMVLNYIESYGGTISLSKAAEDLGITYDELMSFRILFALWPCFNFAMCTQFWLLSLFLEKAFYYDLY
ncbi:MAG: PKD domain-containing protein [Fervidobacterium sp.]